MTSTRPATSLTPREVEVLQGLVDGYNPKELASRWVVSRRTIDIHLGAVYRKLGARDRVQAVVAGLQQGLVQFPDEMRRQR
jgi:two-component system nitrate/nitrite response regulator NarL